MGIKSLLLALGIVVSLVASALADDIKPALIYDMGGKFDKSFNEAAYNGAQEFKTKSGVSYRDFEIQSEAQREQALRRFAKKGFSPIVVTGFSYAKAVETVAGEFPQTKFAIIDMVVNKPNVLSVVFKEHEGSFLVGMLAMMKSKTGKIGFVGGMGIPLIHKFACGYVQGAKSVKADAVILQNMTGNTGAAWNNPVKGAELAKAQIAQGADVIYHAAGGTGLGVLQAAADAGKLGIGVDSNQNHLHPGKVLTSMLKRVDTAVYNVFESARTGKWKAGVRVLGLKEDGVGYAIDDSNRALISDDMKKAVEAAKAKIISGEIRVHDYMTDSKCPG